MSGDVTYIVRTNGTPERSRFIWDALDSVERQSRPSRVVVVLDMAPGPDRELLERAIREIWTDVFADIVTCDRLGFAGPYNRGLEAVRTPYVAVLDDDDVLYSHHAEALAGALDDDARAGVAYAYVRMFRCDPVSNKPLEARADLGAPFSFEDLEDRNRIPVHGAVVRTELARLEPWRADEGPCCDWGYWLRLARRGVGFKHVHSLVGEYRIRNEGDSNAGSAAEMRRAAAIVRARVGR